jgi:hypothetical protein
MGHIKYLCGIDSIIRIATRNGLDGPGCKPRCEARFSAPTQTSPTSAQPLVHWVLSPSPGGEAAGVVASCSCSIDEVNVSKLLYANLFFS